jgi:hypothetical protein
LLGGSEADERAGRCALLARGEASWLVFAFAWYSLLLREMERETLLGRDDDTLRVDFEWDTLRDFDDFDDDDDVPATRWLLARCIIICGSPLFRWSSSSFPNAGCGCSPIVAPYWLSLMLSRIYIYQTTRTINDERHAFQILCTVKQLLIMIQTRWWFKDDEWCAGRRIGSYNAPERYVDVKLNFEPRLNVILCETEVMRTALLVEF